MLKVWLLTISVVAAASVLIVALLGPVDDSDSRQPDIKKAESLNRPVIKDAPGKAPEGMAWIPGGSFLMGSETGPHNDERPVHEVTLDGFWIDQTEITNSQFQKFVDATGYKTVGEKAPDRKEIEAQVPPGTPIYEELLVPGSICFNPKFDLKTLRKDIPDWAHQVWKYEPGADWRHPTGSSSSIDDIMDHPVIHVSWEDAIAYCKWAGRELPTEAQWEFAARGGLESQDYPWGSEREPGGKWRHNTWQGKFPETHEVQDGFETTAPVKSFEPNGYGLYDMSGNVWEWCNDWYRPDYYESGEARNPPGPDKSFDPNEPLVAKRVQRGGSFMCSDDYCTGYRVSARMKGDALSGTFHCGFRTVLNTNKP